MIMINWGLSFKKQIFYVLAILLLIISGIIAASGYVPSSYYSFSAIFIIILALPSLYGLYVGISRQRVYLLIILLSIYSFTIELVAISTGFPYGQFSYSTYIGYKIFDLVPWTLPFAWIPLIIFSYVSASLILKLDRVKKITPKFFLNQPNYLRIILSVLILVYLDLIIDPGAVALMFWHYSYPIGFYGVPLSNFIGWILSATMGNLLLTAIISKMEMKLYKSFYYFKLSIYAILIFWTTVCVVKLLIIPAVLGIIPISLLVNKQISQGLTFLKNKLLKS